MRKVSHCIVFVFLLCCSIRVDAQKIPPYYFDIKEVYQSPYPLMKTDDGYVNYRLLYVRIEEYNTLVVEYYRYRRDNSPSKLLNNYYLKEDDFDIYLFDEINLVEWNSNNSFDISLNEGLCYSVVVGSKEEDVKIKRCD